MRAISLWQPWATAMTVRRIGGTAMLKSNETRGWQPNPSVIGQRLAICAAKTQKDPETRESLRDWWMARVKRDSVYRAIFDAAGFNDWTDLPFGAVLGHGILARVTRTEELGVENYDLLEYDWGDYSPGRFAWTLTDMVVLDRPVPIVGKQGIFWWDKRTAA